MIENPPEVTQTASRPFSQIPRLWLKFFKMDLVFFDVEKEYSSVRNTILGILCISIIAPIQFVISFLVSSIAAGNQIASQLVLPQASFIYAAFCISIFLIPISFFITTGIVHIGALIVGGRGQFSKFTYLFSIFYAPYYIISALLSFIYLIPSIGRCLLPIVSIPMVVYAFVLEVRTIKVVHGISTGKSLLAIFLPIILLFTISCILIVILALLGPAIGSVFSGITESI